jgi:hypothetical protein
MKPISKLGYKLILLIVPLLIYLGMVFVNDIFNVFHYDNIRITSATKDENYIKTRYVLENPDKFNAFIFGSSRVANLPKDGLPVYIDENSDGQGDGRTSLNWYNMTYPMGCPQDNYETLKTFVDGGVDVKYVVIGIDEISMYRTYGESAGEPIYRQYQEYEKNPAKFYYEYLTVKPDFSLLREALSQTDSDREAASLFYEYGVELPNLDISFPEESGKMVSSLGCGGYSSDGQAEYDNPIRALRDIRSLCEERGIKLVIFTSPILKTTYEEAVSKGYFDFLRDAAGVVDFYNFSGLNEYTTDMRFYFDASHYRPYVGLQMENIMFAEAIATSEFGAYTTSDNVEELIQILAGQME